MRSIITILLLLGSGIITAQNPQASTIHREECARYSTFSFNSESSWDSLRLTLNNTPVTPSATRGTSPSISGTCNLTKRVFGWHPYWMGSAYNNYDWSLISDLSFFSFELDAATGNPITTHGWSTANVVTVAQANGVRVNLCVTLFSNHATFLTNPTAQQTFISNIISQVQLRNADGCNIDFEGVPAAQSANFTTFMIDLCNQMHAAIPGSEISIALPSVDWSNVYDVGAMVNYVDVFIIMGYDYYWSGSTTAGPTDPLYNFVTSYNYTVTKSIAYYLNDGIPQNQLLLGLPYYGREWPTAASTIPSATTATGVSRTYSFVQNNPGTYNNQQWDPISYTPYFPIFTTQWNQCFINSPYSLGKRYDMVNQYGIGGIGIWALGYDDGYTELWDKLREKFTTCQVIACSDTIFDMGGPGRNYYDNEDYTFTITPDNASQVSMNFSSFSMELNYDSLFIYDGPSTASPLIGTYTGTNSPGNISASGPSLTLRSKSDVGIVQSGYYAIWNCTPLTTYVPHIYEAAELMIYPNPASPGDEIRFNPAGPSGEITLYDLAGKLIYKQILNGSDAVFRLPPAMESGVYIFSLEQKGQISFHRFIVL